MEPRIISYMSNLGKIIVLIILYIALFGSCSVGQRHVQRTGLYRLVNGYDIYATILNRCEWPKEALVEIQNDSIVTYYIQGKQPIVAEYIIKNDTMIVHSDKFEIDFIYDEIEYDSYIVTMSPETPLISHGKLNDFQVGDCDTFLIKDDFALLIATNSRNLNSHLVRIKPDNKSEIK